MVLKNMVFLAALCLQAIAVCLVLRQRFPYHRKAIFALREIIGQQSREGASFRQFLYAQYKVLETFFGTLALIMIFCGTTVATIQLIRCVDPRWAPPDILVLMTAILFLASVLSPVVIEIRLKFSRR